MPDAGGARSSRWRPLLLLVIAVPLLLGLVRLARFDGIGPIDGGGFDWSPYPSAVHDAVERASRNADCRGLGVQRAWAISEAAKDVDTAPLLAHIDGIRRMLVCID